MVELSVRSHVVGSSGDNAGVFEQDAGADGNQAQAADQLDDGSETHAEGASDEQTGSCHCESRRTDCQRNGDDVDVHQGEGDADGSRVDARGDRGKNQR